jgi:two-component system chemotaxis response regulator CheB
LLLFSTEATLLLNFILFSKVILQVTDKIKILLVDDSISYKQILLAVIENIPDAECVGTVASVSLALIKIAELKPDMVLLDVEMPVMDAVANLQMIRTDFPEVYAIMISSYDLSNDKQTLHALRIGALDFIAKPKTLSPEQGILELTNYLQPFVNLMQTRKYASFSHNTQFANPKPVVTTVKPPSRPAIEHKFDLIVIGISTGGPKALDELIPKLNPALPCPIIIVQHMPPLFTESLAQKLNDSTSLQVSEIKGGENIARGHIYIAQGGKHAVLREHAHGGFYLAISETPPVNNCCPSVDELFRSVAAIFKGRVLAIIMTGMGRDGTEGVKLLKRNICKCIIQDKASSIVWGMPGSVFDAGLADEVVPLKQLGERISALTM